MNSFLTIVVAGVFSCIALDLFGRILLTLFKIPEPSWGVVGRWVFYIFRRGVFFNPQVSDAMPIVHEEKIGWAFHYLIAVLWAVVFHIFFVSYPLFELSYINGLLFGALTTLAPLFIFMPFTGQGILARKTKMPYLTSLILLERHSVFGLAMSEAFTWFH
tara:strand:- start:226 stop:705 length:480 start_codon:yes stop_codon:yes gene_type:complete